jgi:hypothetical protein
LNKKRRFVNWICFLPQDESVGQLEATNQAVALIQHLILLSYSFQDVGISRV